MMFIAPSVMPYGTAARHCSADRDRSGGRKIASSISEERPMRMPAVPTAPSTGKSPLAIAAPLMKLKVATMTAGTGGIDRRVVVSIAGIVIRLAFGVWLLPAVGDGTHSSPPHSRVAHY